MQALLFTWAVAAAVTICQPARAADYTNGTTPTGDIVLRLSGPITSVDGAIFLEQVNRHKPRIVEIEGLGGDFLSAVRIGVIIHERDMSTYAVGECRSACAFVWIAGLHMLADEGVEIASHLPAPSLEEHPNHRGTALFGWYLGKLNISVDMMEAFLDRATGFGTVPNQYFDMLEFARYWNAPVRIIRSGEATTDLSTSK